MGSRVVKVNEIVGRTLNNLLRTIYKDQAICMTITEVHVSPDLHDAYVYYSVVGNDKNKEMIENFLSKKSCKMRMLLSKKITLKYSPKLNFRPDNSIEQGSHLVDVINQL